MRRDKDDEGTSWVDGRTLPTVLGMTRPEMTEWLATQWWWLQFGQIRDGQDRPLYHPRYVEQLKALRGIPNDLAHPDWLEAYTPRPPISQRPRKDHHARGLRPRGARPKRTA